MDSIGDWLGVSDLRCIAHPSSPARAICYRCGGFICERCELHQGKVTLCRPCDARLVASLVRPLASAAAWKLAFVPVLLIALTGWRLVHQQPVGLEPMSALWVVPLVCAALLQVRPAGALVLLGSLVSVALLATQWLPVLLDAPTAFQLVDLALLAAAPLMALLNGLELIAAVRELRWLELLAASDG